VYERPRKDVESWAIYGACVGFVIGAAISGWIAIQYDPSKIVWMNVARQQVDPGARWWGGLCAIVVICTLLGVLWGQIIDWVRQRRSDQRWRAQRRAAKQMMDRELKDALQDLKEENQEET